MKADTAGAPKALPADVQSTMSEAADLDLLVALTPLKLTSDQIDKLTDSLQAIVAADEGLTKEACESIRTVADDIDKARAAALKGTPPDAETTARINKVFADIDARNDSAHQAAVHKIVDTATNFLAPEQVKAVEVEFAGWNKGKISVPGSLRDDPDKRDAYVENAALTAFTERILLVQRAITVLKALKASAPTASAVSATAPASTAGDPTPADSTTAK